MPLPMFPAGLLRRLAAAALCVAAAWGVPCRAQPPGEPGRRAAPAAPPRNIVFILSDDHRYDFMGLPSRASILTGQYAHRHGVVDNTSPIPEGTVFFPEALREAGYRTAYIGKWHLGEVDDSPQPGFDHWVSFRGQGVYENPVLNVNGDRQESRGYTTDILTDLALEWLERHRTEAGDRPFFLYLSHKAVHAEFVPAARHRGRYAKVAIPSPETMADTETARREKPRWVREQRYSWHGVEHMYHGAMQFDDFYRAYAETLLALDESIGRVMAYLERAGLSDSTLVVYMGDNGFLLGEHGLIDKRNAYEESMRAPMLAWAPGLIPRGSAVQTVVRNIDVAPTLLDVAGLPASARMDGRSVLPALRGEPQAGDGEVLYEYYWEYAFPHTPTTLALRTDRYKFIYYPGVWDRQELYDLERDPRETRNLVDEPAHRERVSQMRQRLWTLLEQSGGMQVPLRRGTWQAGERKPDPADPHPFVEDLERRTFQWFWDTANPANGLVPDRWPDVNFSSIAAIGFGLTAYGVGAERGYVTRDAARDRTLATLRFLWRAPQGPGTDGVTGYRGFFYHFLDMAEGRRHATTELSSIDTALLMAGVLFAQSYFDRDEAGEREIRELAEALYRRVEWTWMQARPPLIAMGWRPERGMTPHDYRGYEEAMLLYVLALGSPTHPIAPDAWAARLGHYRWERFQGVELVNYPPLFIHQYSHAWIDFRGIRDAYMRERGLDYFENSRRAVRAQREYAIANPSGFRDYGPDIWGLTASLGPAAATAQIDGRPVQFRRYWARGASATEVRDDGTIAPTAAGGSIAFAPEIALPALEAMRARYGSRVYRRYGFIDAFNPTFAASGLEPTAGTVTPDGWFADDYLGIDQGPILLMIENWRSGLVWEVMRRNPHLVRGLCRAGFTGGWIEGRCH